MKPHTQIKQSLKKICPPIMLPLLRKLNAVVRGSNETKSDKGEKPASWYDDHYQASEEYRKPFFRSVYYPLWSVIADRILAKGFESINDIGCGAGQFAELLRFHGVPVYRGLDLSEEAIGLANSRDLGYRFEVRDVIASPPTDIDEFDCTVSLEFLEHVEQDLDVISALPEGHSFIGTVPNFPFISHVRHFQDEAQVIARYGEFFESLSVSTHMGDKEGKLFFLLDGVRGAG